MRRSLLWQQQLQQAHLGKIYGTLGKTFGKEVRQKAEERGGDG